MTQMAKGQPKIPKFLSTHPENQDRQERLRSHIDEVRSQSLYLTIGDGKMGGSWLW
jgi:predicted Zn-dependent protease